MDEKHNIIGIKLNTGRIHHIPIEDPKKEKRKYKHHDFELYGKYIFDKDIIPKDKNKIYNNIKYIKKGYLTKEIIDDRFKEFENKYIIDNKLSIKDRIFKYRFYLFTKEELDNIFSDCCNLVVKEIERINKKD